MTLESRFALLERDIYANCHPTKEGSFYFRFGGFEMAYNIKRADFDYREEIGSHAFFTDQALPSSVPFRVLNVGVGAGLEVKKPLSYLRSIAQRRQVVYKATNLNTPVAKSKDGTVRVLYEQPSDEFLHGRDWSIDYTYHERYALEEEERTEDIHLLLASRVVEWSGQPGIWFQKAHDALAPGGIAIIHTLPWVGTNPYYRDPVELAKDAGFSQGYAPVSYQYEPGGKPILKMFLYKSNETSNEYPDWVRKNRKVNHFMRVTADMDNSDFINPVFALANTSH